MVVVLQKRYPSAVDGGEVLNVIGSPEKEVFAAAAGAAADAADALFFIIGAVVSSGCRAIVVIMTAVRFLLGCNRDDSVHGLLAAAFLT